MQKQKLAKNAKTFPLLKVMNSNEVMVRKCIKMIYF